MPERGWSVPAYRGRSRVLGLGYILSVHSKMKIPTQHLPLPFSVPAGKVRELSGFSPGNWSCGHNPWTSINSERQSGVCSRAWTAASRAFWACGPAPTCPHCAMTHSVVSTPLFSSLWVTAFLNCSGLAHRLPPLFLSSLTTTAACQPPCLLPASPHLDYLPLWLQWMPQPQPRVRPRKRRRPRIRPTSLSPVLHAAYVSLHRWGGCGPHCQLRGEATVALHLLPKTRWTPQQDWYWARRYGLPSVVRVDLTRLAPALPAAPAPTGSPAPVPTPDLVPKQALAFAPFCPPKRLRLVVSHGSIDLDINSGEP